MNEKGHPSAGGAAAFYLGVWVPTALCWLIVVLVAAFTMEGIAVWKGIGAALLGPAIAIAVGTRNARGDEKSSRGYVSAHGDLSSATLFRRGLKKGWLLGPASVIGVAALAAMPWLLDRMLTAFGK